MVLSSLARGRFARPKVGAGDVITSVDGSAIQSEARLAALLAALKPGMQIGLGYTRSGVARTGTVTLGASWG